MTLFQNVEYTTTKGYQIKEDKGAQQ